MANERVYWSGKVGRFCFLDRLDNFGRWSTTFYPDNKAYNEIMQLKQEGLQNHVKKDDDGYYINLSRPTEVGLRNGNRIPMAAPEILDKDGKTPIKGPLGTGSDVTIKVEVRKYTSPQGRPGVSIRLESVRVDNLVPFEPQRDFPPAQAKLVAGLDKAPRSEAPF